MVEDAHDADARDTGEGISGEHLPHIFDRFSRADAARVAVPATSGLAISLAVTCDPDHKEWRTLRRWIPSVRV